MRTVNVNKTLAVALVIGLCCAQIWSSSISTHFWAQFAHLAPPRSPPPWNGPIKFVCWSITRALPIVLEFGTPLHAEWLKSTSGQIQDGGRHRNLNYLHRNSSIGIGRFRWILVCMCILVLEIKAVNYWWDAAALSENAALIIIHLSYFIIHLFTICRQKYRIHRGTKSTGLQNSTNSCHDKRLEDYKNTGRLMCQKMSCHRIYNDRGTHCEAKTFRNVPKWRMFKMRRLQAIRLRRLRVPSCPTDWGRNDTRRRRKAAPIITSRGTICRSWSPLTFRLIV